MKKLFAITSILFLLISCGSDDDNSGSGDPNAVLLRSFKLTDDFGTSTVGTYQYDGNKITRISYDDGSYEVYTYTGMLITKSEYFEDGAVSQRQTLTYDTEGRLMVATQYDNDPDLGGVNRSTYSYNTDGTITVQISAGPSETDLQPQETGTITMENGNITRYSAVYVNQGQPEVFTYEFDNKHTPLKNVIGYDVFNLITLEGGVNNITKYSISPDMEAYATTYQYDPAGFPVRSTEDEGDGDAEVIEYFYQ